MSSNKQALVVQDHKHFCLSVCKHWQLSEEKKMFRFFLSKISVNSFEKRKPGRKKVTISGKLYLNFCGCPDACPKSLNNCKLELLSSYPKDVLSPKFLDGWEISLKKILDSFFSRLNVFPLYSPQKTLHFCVPNFQFVVVKIYVPSVITTSGIFPWRGGDKKSWGSNVKLFFYSKSPLS